MTMTCILPFLIFTVSMQSQALSPCTGKETKTTTCTFKVTYRDFQAQKLPNTLNVPNMNSKYLPDFQSNLGFGLVTGMVKPFLNSRTHKPELSNSHRLVTSPETFSAWYDECAGPAGPGLTCGPTSKTCRKAQQANGIPCGYSYKFYSEIAVKYNENTKKYSLENNDDFFPLSNDRCPVPLVNGKCGWGDQPWGYTKNFAFTTELNLIFKFKGGETFQFSGDDDVWVFIGSRLVVDIGGVHGLTCRTLALPEANCNSDCKGVVKDCSTGEVKSIVDVSHLKVGKMYRFDLFHAERHTTQSNFNFETTLDLKEDTCKDFLRQLKAGTYKSPELDAGLLVTEENCPAEKFELEEFKDSSFCDIRQCKPGYEAVGRNYLRLRCDGDKLISSGKAFKCRKITSSDSVTASTSPTSTTPASTTDSTTAATTTATNCQCSFLGVCYPCTSGGMRTTTTTAGNCECSFLGVCYPCTSGSLRSSPSKTPTGAVSTKSSSSSTGSPNKATGTSTYSLTQVTIPPGVDTNRDNSESTELPDVVDSGAVLIVGTTITMFVIITSMI